MISKDFVIPKFVSIEDGATDRYARFVVEPFERGYGTTVGNSLRRVLLSSLEGACVTAIRIENVPHEFSAIPGVQEDVTDVTMNFKNCQLKLNRQEPLIFSFVRKGKGEVTAGEIFADTEVDVFNPDQVVMTVTSKSAKVEMEIKVDQGRGYVTSDVFELEHAPIGTIYLDASFSPVERVNFVVEDARVGQTTDYDRLLLDIWTDSSITPAKALEEAADKMIDHLKIFVQQRAEDQQDDASSTDEDPQMRKLLSRPVEELELSVRAANCLKAANIKTIGELVIRSEPELLQFHNFGKKSLDEILAILEAMGLTLNMKGGASADESEASPEAEEA